MKRQRRHGRGSGLLYRKIPHLGTVAMSDDQLMSSVDNPHHLLADNFDVPGHFFMRPFLVLPGEGIAAEGYYNLQGGLSRLLGFKTVRSLLSAG
jgi:hypothetical protein